MQRRLRSVGVVGLLLVAAAAQLRPAFADFTMLSIDRSSCISADNLLQRDDFLDSFRARAQASFPDLYEAESLDIAQLSAELCGAYLEVSIALRSDAFMDSFSVDRATPYEIATLTFALGGADDHPMSFPQMELINLYLHYREPVQPTPISHPQQSIS